MCSEMGFCFVPLFSPVCINPRDTMKELERLEHLLGSGLLISFFRSAPNKPVRGVGTCGRLLCRSLPSSRFSLPDLLLRSHPASSCGGVGGKDELKLRGKIG